MRSHSNGDWIPAMNPAGKIDENPPSNGNHSLQ